MSNADNWMDEHRFDALETELREAWLHADDERPRNKQTKIGPSGAGHKCERHLAFKMTSGEHEDGGSMFDPLPSMIGTLLHGYAEEMVVPLLNKRAGYERFLSERVVEQPVKGTCDLFDTELKMVIDWKTLGATSFKKLTQHGPGPEYQVQIDIYGMGYEFEGYEVEHVGIAAIPRAGRLRDLYLYHRPYDRENAIKHTARLRGIEKKVLEEKTPPAMLPATPGEWCRFCPWRSALGDGPRSCIGDLGDPNPSQGVDLSTRETRREH